MKKRIKLAIYIILAILLVPFAFSMGKILVGYASIDSMKSVIEYRSTCSMAHYMSYNDWWQQNGYKYEHPLNITQEEFKDFPHHNGFDTFKLFYISEPEEYHIGDLVIFEKLSRPFIHRIVDINEEAVITMGDHKDLWDSHIIGNKTTKWLPKQKLDGKITLYLNPTRMLDFMPFRCSLLLGEQCREKCREKAE